LVGGEEVGEDYDLDSADEFYAETYEGRRYRIVLDDAPTGRFVIWSWSVYDMTPATREGSDALIARITHKRPQWLGHPYDYTRVPGSFLASGGQSTLWNTIQQLIE